MCIRDSCSAPLSLLQIYIFAYAVCANSAVNRVTRKAADLGKVESDQQAHRLVIQPVLVMVELAVGVALVCSVQLVCT